MLMAEGSELEVGLWVRGKGWFVEVVYRWGVGMGMVCEVSRGGQQLPPLQTIRLLGSQTIHY